MTSTSNSAGESSKIKEPCSKRWRWRFKDMKIGTYLLIVEHAWRDERPIIYNQHTLSPERECPEKITSGSTNPPAPQISGGESHVSCMSFITYIFPQSHMWQNMSSYHLLILRWTHVFKSDVFVGCKIVFSCFVCYVSVTFFAVFYSVICHKPKRDLASLHILLALQNANQMYVISWTRQVWYWCWRELTRWRRQIQTSSLTYILGFMILYIKTNKMVYMLMLIIKKGMAGSNCKSRLHILCKYKRNIYDWGGTVNDFFWCKRLF